MESLEHVDSQLVSAIVNGLKDQKSFTEAEQLESCASAKEFDSLCQDFIVDGGPAGRAVEQIMFLFYDWDNSGSDEQSISKFVDKYDIHPAKVLCTARLYWNSFVGISRVWKQEFPEVANRFDRIDYTRIPYTLKRVYSQVFSAVVWMPVPDYGAPLKAQKVKIVKNGVPNYYDLPAGVPYKDFMQRSQSLKQMNLQGG